MASVFDATSYFTRRQSDLRYVQAPLNAAEITALFTDSSGNGTLPGGLLVPQSVTALQVANGAIGLEQMLGNIRPPVILNALPALPNAVYPIGAQVYLTIAGTYNGNTIPAGQLWTTTDGTTWKPLLNAPDLSGILSPSQLQGAISSVAAFAQGLTPISVVDSLPTLPCPPYVVGSMVMLTVTGKLYKLTDEGGGNTSWAPIITASNIDVTAGLIDASQIDVDSLTAGIVTAGAVKAAMISVGTINASGTIAAGNVVTESMTAGTISGSVIEVGTLSAGAIDTTTITAGSAILTTLTAGILTAGAITTSMLVVGSFDNLVEDGDIENPITSGSWIPVSGGLTIGSGYQHVGNYSLVCAGTGNSTIKNRMIFDVKDAQSGQTADKIYIEGVAGSYGADGTLTIQVNFYSDRACTQPVPGSLSLSYPGQPGWQYKFVTDQPNGVPPGAAWAQTVVTISGQTRGVWAAGEIYVHKMVVSAYIDELDANLIQTGTLNANLVTVINLNADSITSGTIDCDSITVTNVNGQNIKTGTISSGSIGSLTVGGGANTGPGVITVEDSTGVTVAQIGNVTIDGGNNYGIWAKKAWFGGSGPSTALISAVDGTFTIGSSVSIPGGNVSGDISGNAASINGSIPGGKVTGTMTAGAAGSGASITEFLIKDNSSNTVAWIGYDSVTQKYGLWAENIWIGGTGPGNAPIACSGGSVSMSASTTGSSGSCTGNANSASTAYTWSPTSGTWLPSTVSLSASAILAGTLSVGGQLPSGSAVLPGQIEVYDSGGSLTAIIGNLSTQNQGRNDLGSPYTLPNGQQYGIWCKAMGIGGSGPHSAQIYTDASGNAYFAGTLATGVSINSPVITITSDSITTNIDATNFIKITNSATTVTSQLTYAQLIISKTNDPSAGATVEIGGFYVAGSGGVNLACLTPGFLQVQGLPSSPMTNQHGSFWYDPSDSNRVKYVP